MRESMIPFTLIVDSEQFLLSCGQFNGRVAERDSKVESEVVENTEEEYRQQNELCGRVEGRY